MIDYTHDIWSRVVIYKWYYSWFLSLVLFPRQINIDNYQHIFFDVWLIGFDKEDVLKIEDISGGYWTWFLGYD